MLAIFGGLLALLLGLLLLLLPLLVSELSRPRDSVWGAVVLLLGLVLVTSADRLIGAPMLGVLCGGLLIGRLGLEVGQARWRALSDGERQQLGSRERWQRSLEQLLASLAALLQTLRQSTDGLLSWWEERRQKPAVTKRWVRAEESPAPDALQGPPAAASPAVDSPAKDDTSMDDTSMDDTANDDTTKDDTANDGNSKDDTLNDGMADAGQAKDSLAGAGSADPETPGLRQVSDFGAIEDLINQAPLPGAWEPAAVAGTSPGDRAGSEPGPETAVPPGGAAGEAG